jgi:hypothetical protein
VNIVNVNDKMQQNYVYYLQETAGENFHSEFTPELTPSQMLELGVFGGKYLTDCQGEFPQEWFKKAKLSPKGRDPLLNFFKVDASQSLVVWQEKGWINKEHDPRGWFQWFCRYFMGRRLQDEDVRQIKRWKAMKRHVSQVQNNCTKGDWSCRPRQRQALLQWAYDSRDL